MTQRTARNGSGTRQTVSRSFEVIELLEREECLGITEIAEEVGLAKSTVHAYLKTLEQCGYVVQEETKYRLAYRVSLLGESVRKQSRLFVIGRDEIDNLADETGLYAHLSVEEEGKGINLYQSKGGAVDRYDYQSKKVQKPDHLHVTATGKAILASLSPETADSILDAHGLPRRTPQTITDKETMLDELATIRDRGYAYNDEEEIKGFRAVGVSVCSPSGEVLGAISVSGPKSMLESNRFRDTIPEVVTRTSNLIEVTLNMSTDYAPDTAER